MDNIILTPLKEVTNPKGNIFHVIKKSDYGYSGFGEAYFSTINQSEIKGWKKHTKMTLNLVVPIGEIEFVVHNENTKQFFNVKLSKYNYQRLTIKSGLWVAFKGYHEFNLLLNIASIEHNPNEALSMDLNKIKYNWNL